MCSFEQLKTIGVACNHGKSAVSRTMQLPRLMGRRAFLSSTLAFSVAPIVSRLPANAQSGMEVKEIARGVFVHEGRYEVQSPTNRGDMANSSFIIGDDAVAVIDTLGSVKAARELRSSIKAITDKPIRYVINSHMHPDHVLGNAAFKDDQPIFVGHHMLASSLSQRGDQYLAANKQLLGDDAFEGCEIILPTKSVENQLTLDIGSRSLVLEAQTKAHTDNDLIITDTATNTLFLGDLLFSGHIPTLDGSIRGWLALMEQLKGRSAARVVPGHGPHAMQLPDAMLPEERYWNRVVSDIREMIQQGQTLQDASKTAGFSERGNWQLFDEFHVRNVIAAFTELEWE